MPKTPHRTTCKIIFDGVYVKNAADSEGIASLQKNSPGETVHKSNPATEGKNLTRFLVGFADCAIQIKIWIAAPAADLVFPKPKRRKNNSFSQVSARKIFDFQETAVPRASKIKDF